MRIERHQHDENGVTRGDATTSRGEREGGAKASATQEQLNIQCAAATGERAWSLDDGYGLSWKCCHFRCRPQLVLTTWFRVFPTRPTCRRHHVMSGNFFCVVCRVVT